MTADAAGPMQFHHEDFPAVQAFLHHQPLTPPALRVITGGLPDMAQDAGEPNPSPRGRHRAAELPVTADPAVAPAVCLSTPSSTPGRRRQHDATDARALLTAGEPASRVGVAGLLPTGVGGSAFHAAIDAARNPGGKLATAGNADAAPSNPADDLRAEGGLPQHRSRLSTLATSLLRPAVH